VQQPTVETKQEAAILELTEALNKELHSLQVRLDDSFERVEPDVGKDAEGRPTMPNVLDEINLNLHSAIQRVQKMHEFVIHAVVHKIHNI